MVWIDEMIRSIEAENSCFSAGSRSFVGTGSSNVIMASSLGICSSRSSESLLSSRVDGIISSGS